MCSVHPSARKKLQRLETAPPHRPNQPMHGLLTSTGQPMMAWMDDKFEEYLDTGAFVIVPHSFLKLVSPVSVEPKKPRWICDHRVLNEYLVPPNMCYDDLNAFRKELVQGDVLFTVDLAAGYNHVTVAADTRPYMGGKWGSRTFTCAALSFGCSISPFVFQRITKALGMH
jgi:hypothetical protein